VGRSREGQDKRHYYASGARTRNGDIVVPIKDVDGSMQLVVSELVYLALFKWLASLAIIQHTALAANTSQQSLFSTIDRHH
jgi:hypothetical protein